MLGLGDADMNARLFSKRSAHAHALLSSKKTLLSDVFVCMQDHSRHRDIRAGD
jgi:hypothetical protein